MFIKRDIPQGSILGPLLFLVSINDLHLYVSSVLSYVLFADDVICLSVELILNIFLKL